MTAVGADAGTPGGARPAAGARERIVRTAYELFCRHGLQAVGVDRIIAEAGVAKTTLYRHFRSKDDLVLACLELRGQLWTCGWLEREVTERAQAPEARLLAIFDALDEWFRRTDYEGCLFISSLLERHERTSAVGAASAIAMGDVRALVHRLAEEAGLADPTGLADKWQILMSGAIILALAGELDAALRSREVASLLLERVGRSEAPV